MASMVPTAILRPWPISCATTSGQSATRDKLILAGTHGEGKRLTSMLRDELPASGAHWQEYFQFKALTGRWFEQIDVQCGDKLRFTKKDASSGWSMAPVVWCRRWTDGTSPCALESDIASQNGREVTIDMDQQELCARLGAPCTSRKGRAKDEVFMLANLFDDRQPYGPRGVHPNEASLWAVWNP